MLNKLHNFWYAYVDILIDMHTYLWGHAMLLIYYATDGLLICKIMCILMSNLKSYSTNFYRRPFALKLFRCLGLPNAWLESVVETRIGEQLLTHFFQYLLQNVTHTKSMNAFMENLLYRAYQCRVLISYNCVWLLATHGLQEHKKQPHEGLNSFAIRRAAPKVTDCLWWLTPVNGENITQYLFVS